MICYSNEVVLSQAFAMFAIFVVVALDAKFFAAKL